MKERGGCSLSLIKVFCNSHGGSICRFTGINAENINDKVLKIVLVFTRYHAMSNTRIHFYILKILQ